MVALLGNVQFTCRRNLDCKNIFTLERRDGLIILTFCNLLVVCFEHPRQYCLFEVERSVGILPVADWLKQFVDAFHATLVFGFYVAS